MRGMVLDYRSPQNRRYAWEDSGWFKLLMVICIVASLYSWFYSVVFSHMPVATPQYFQYVRAMQAQAATQPAGTPVNWPPFVGQMQTLRSMFSLPITYFAIGLSGAAAVMVFVSIRKPKG
jgi:hypothetical protein